MKNLSNKQAWAIAKEGRLKTIAAANAAISSLRRDGVIGYCEDSKPFRALLATAEMAAKLMSDAPADYWHIYPHRDPSDFDSTVWVKQKESECHEIAAKHFAF